ncbi:MAG: hypothetical protein HDR41_00635 [Lactobacillus sp.]|nr:hypothetical protein [Lactobacillus sp.]
MSENITISQILQSFGQSIDELPALQLPQTKGHCAYCNDHKKFEVMDGYFMAQIKGKKLYFELGNFSDPYEVSPFDIDLDYCFACGRKLKNETKNQKKEIKTKY